MILESSGTNYNRQDKCNYYTLKTVKWQHCFKIYKYRHTNTPWTIYLVQVHMLLCISNASLGEIKIILCTKLYQKSYFYINCLCSQSKYNNNIQPSYVPLQTCQVIVSKSRIVCSDWTEFFSVMLMSRFQKTH